MFRPQKMGYRSKSEQVKKINKLQDRSIESIKSQEQKEKKKNEKSEQILRDLWDTITHKYGSPKRKEKEKWKQ